MDSDSGIKWNQVQILDRSHGVHCRENQGLLKRRAGPNRPEVDVWAGEDDFPLCRSVGFCKVALGVTDPGKIGEQME